jgi:hypothetical protein
MSDSWHFARIQPLEFSKNRYVTTSPTNQGLGYKPLMGSSQTLPYLGITTYQADHLTIPDQ